MTASLEPTETPRLRPGLDLMKAGLTVEEGFLASRIDGRTTVRELSHLICKPMDATVRLLDRLKRAGVVVIGDVPDDGPRPDQIGGNDPYYGNFIFPPGLMAEEGDLPPAHRKRIIWFHAHLEKWSHYELLQVPRKADEPAIKRAYYQRSKEWHPDRFRFASDLGSFRPMLEQVFERIRTAYGVLGNPDQRKVYDADHILMVGEDDIAEMLKAHRRDEREKRREIEAIERRKKKNPMRRRVRRAKTLLGDAVKEREDGDVLKALGLAQIAEAYDGRAEHQELVEALKKEAAEARVAPLLRRGAHHESLTQWSDAIELLEEAVRIAPDNGPARVRLAYNLLRGGQDPHGATSHAQRGVALLPEEPEAHFVLGLCYDRAGKERAAVRALGKAVELKPNYKEAKKRLRELKWGF